MASIEHPSAPRTPPPPAEASEVHDDNRGQPSADESSRTFNSASSPLKNSIARPTNRKDIEAHDVVKDTLVCDELLTQHLRVPPSPFDLTKTMNNYISQIRSAGSSEPKMYKPAASLLTAISKEMYGMLLMLMDFSKSPHSQSFGRATG